jgi:hypothetical protein
MVIGSLAGSALRHSSNIAHTSTNLIHRRMKASLNICFNGEAATRHAKSHFTDSLPELTPLSLENIALANLVNKFPHHRFGGIRGITASIFRVEEQAKHVCLLYFRL